MGMAAPQEGGVSFQSGAAQVGLRLASKTGDRVLQIQRQGFTYSHLPPYTSWETFRDEVGPLWEAFLGTCSPAEITRVAVRFINRIVIPKVPFEMFDYLNLYPQLPKGVPQDDVTGFFMQLQMPQSDIAPETLAVINVALEGPSTPGTGTILLDFDVFRQAKYPADSDAAWVFLEELRKRKNELFEACITDETRKLIS